MKHFDGGIGGVRSRLSPLARPFTLDSSSSAAQQGISTVFSLAASESEPEDSIWGDFTFDLSFLTSDDRRSGLGDDSLSNLSRDAEATTLLKGIERSRAEGSSLYRQAAYASGTRTYFEFPVKHERITLEDTTQDSAQSFHGLSSYTESDLRLISSASVLRDTGTASAANGPVKANASSGNGGVEEQLSYTNEKTACFGKVSVNHRFDENNPNSLLPKMSELRIRCSPGADNGKLDLLDANATRLAEKSCTLSDQDDSEVDSPCWRGTQSYNTVTTLGSRPMSSRRSSDDLNRLSILNPLAPDFVPATAKKSLEKHSKACEESSFSSLKKSLSSTFPLSSRDDCLFDDSHKASIHQSCSRASKANLDQSLGLVSQNSVLDSSNEFQMSKKLDPLAPVFVPASFGNQYYNRVNEPKTSDLCKPLYGSEGEISKNSSLRSSNDRLHGGLRSNHLAHQFSLSDNKTSVDGSGEFQTRNDSSHVMNSAVSAASSVYRNQDIIDTALVRSKSSIYIDPHSNGINTVQRHSCRSSSTDVRKLLTTMSGLSELLPFVQDNSCGSDSEKEQEDVLINNIIQNLNFYIGNRVKEHAGNHSSNPCSGNIHKLPVRDLQQPREIKRTVDLDLKRKEKNSIVSGETEQSSSAQVMADRDSRPEEQIHPHVLFYRSLWLKAEAERCLIEYEASLPRTNL